LCSKFQYKNQLSRKAGFCIRVYAENSSLTHNQRRKVTAMSIIRAQRDAIESCVPQSGGTSWLRNVQSALFHFPKRRLVFKMKPSGKNLFFLGFSEPRFPKRGGTVAVFSTRRIRSTKKMSRVVKAKFAGTLSAVLLTPAPSSKGGPQKERVERLTVSATSFDSNDVTLHVGPTGDFAVYPRLVTG
jgi:hypothetical protein